MTYANHCFDVIGLQKFLICIKPGFTKFFPNQFTIIKNWNSIDEGKQKNKMIRYEFISQQIFINYLPGHEIFDGPVKHPGFRIKILMYRFCNADITTPSA
jgi:hypothetical protein